MNKKILILVTVIILIILSVFYLKKNAAIQPTLPSTDNQVVDNSQLPYYASFLIYTNGLKRDFSAVMYHNLSGEAYITTPNPNIVIVNSENLTWNDFFQTLPFSLDSNCLTTGTGETFCEGQSGSLRFFINGVENSNALNQIINNNDKLLVTFGNNTDSEINIQNESIPEIP